LKLVDKLGDSNSVLGTNFMIFVVAISNRMIMRTTPPVAVLAVGALGFVCIS
jgi:hypothetical protein